MATNQDNSQDFELWQSRLTAYALGQLDDQQSRQVEDKLKSDNAARQTVQEVQLLSQALLDAGQREDLPPASTELRETIMNRLDNDKKVERGNASAPAPAPRGRAWVALVVAICLLIVAVPVGWWMISQKADDYSVASNSGKAGDSGAESGDRSAGPGEDSSDAESEERYIAVNNRKSIDGVAATDDKADWAARSPRPQGEKSPAQRHDPSASKPMSSAEPVPAGPPAGGAAPERLRRRVRNLPELAKSEVKLVPYFDAEAKPEIDPHGSYGDPTDGNQIGNEQYDQIIENPFRPVNEQHARSTFSIDVDTASYANVRRFLTRNMLPPPDAVRIEEMVNYFSYDYPQPEGEIPFSVNMEVADAPWKPSHRLLRIGLKGLEVDRDERPASNLVFLLDVSGSMRASDKLPLLQQAMKMLVRELHENDLITIVTYAGNAGLRLDATPGDQQDKILQAIDSLSVGGSTHGSAGIKLAYEKAVENFIDEGTNRVILATDGDLNVGVTQDDALVNLIKDKAASGVFLTVLGFGTGNLKDSKMEKLADNGNGVYAYIDSRREARKVLVEQISGSLVTIAKDVKIQIEFNPAEVQSYRLIGYENRLLAREDFDDDTKDAGEIGAGHTVTALYELVPAGADVKEQRGSGELKYQKTDKPETKKPEDLTDAAATGELLTLWLRYKQPDADKSRKLEFTLKDRGQKFNRSSQDYQFAAAVAAFGMMLRGSEHRGSMSYSAIEEIAASAAGKDPRGYRMEFVDLVRKASQLQR